MGKKTTSLITTRQDVHKLLSSFERECKDMVLQAIDAGCTGKFSSNTHVILRNANGSTVSISRQGNPANRGLQNIRSNFRQFMDEHELAKAATTKGPEYRPLPTDPTIMRTLSFKEALVDKELSQIASLFLDKNPAIQAEEMVSVVHGPEGIELVRQLKAEAGLGDLGVSTVAYECPVCKGMEFREVKALEKHIEDAGHVQCELVWEDGPQKGEVCGKWLKNWRAKGPHRSIDHLGHKPWQHRDTWQKGHGQPDREPGGRTSLVPESRTRKKTEPVFEAPQAPETTTPVKAEKKTQAAPKPAEETPVETKKTRAAETPVEILPKVEEALASEAAAKLNAIRGLLGEDPRVAELTEELSTLRGELAKALEDGEEKDRRIRHVEGELAELKAKFDLAREAFGL